MYVLTAPSRYVPYKYMDPAAQLPSTPCLALPCVREQPGGGQAATTCDQHRRRSGAGSLSGSGSGSGTGTGTGIYWLWLGSGSGSGGADGGS